MDAVLWGRTADTPGVVCRGSSGPSSPALSLEPGRLRIAADDPSIPGLPAQSPHTDPHPFPHTEAPCARCGLPLRLDATLYRAAVEAGDPEPPRLLRCPGGHSVRLNPVLPRVRPRGRAAKPCVVCGYLMVGAHSTRQACPGACALFLRNERLKAKRSDRPFVVQHQAWYRGPDRLEYHAETSRLETPMPTAWRDGYFALYGDPAPEPAA